MAYVKVCKVTFCRIWVGACVRVCIFTVAYCVLLVFFVIILAEEGCQIQRQNTQNKDYSRNLSPSIHWLLFTYTTTIYFFFILVFLYWSCFSSSFSLCGLFILQLFLLTKCVILFVFSYNFITINTNVCEGKRNKGCAYIIKSPGCEIGRKTAIFLKLNIFIIQVLGLYNLLHVQQLLSHMVVTLVIVTFLNTIIGCHNL